MSTLLAECWIGGRPRSKGSLKVISGRGRKPVMVEDHRHSKPWRTQMTRELKAHLIRIKSNEIHTGPVAVAVTFVFERRGPSAQLLPWPTLNAGVNANGDLDKLLRNVLDALTDAGVIADDSQVCKISSEKRWGDLSGVEVSVWMIDAPDE